MIDTPKWNPSFGDNVRIRITKETEDAAVAGLAGQVYGETTPSITGVDVIGTLSEDYAINVHCKERDESYWLVPDLLEFVDHAGGTEIRLDGVDRKWMRTADGGWHGESLTENKRPWWQFW